MEQRLQMGGLLVTTTTKITVLILYQLQFHVMFHSKRVPVNLSPYDGLQTRGSVAQACFASVTVIYDE